MLGSARRAAYTDGQRRPINGRRFWRGRNDLNRLGALRGEYGRREDTLEKILRMPVPGARPVVARQFGARRMRRIGAGQMVVSVGEVRVVVVVPVPVVGEQLGESALVFAVDVRTLAAGMLVVIEPRVRDGDGQCKQRRDRQTEPGELRAKAFHRIH